MITLLAHCGKYMVCHTMYYIIKHWTNTFSLFHHLTRLLGGLIESAFVLLGSISTAASHSKNHNTAKVKALLKVAVWNICKISSLTSKDLRFLKQYNLLWTFLTTTCTWHFQYSLLTNVIHRYLYTYFFQHWFLLKSTIISFFFFSCNWR